MTFSQTEQTEQTALFQRIVSQARLITLPGIYLRLKSLMEDPEYTMAEVAQLVGKDPGLSARFLRFVNSPMNRRACRIETVSHAVSLLGSRQIHDIVLSVAVAEAFKGMSPELMDMHIYWRKSFHCALLAGQLARHLDLPGLERMFTIALLHDIGHLVMYSAAPREAQLALEQARQSKRPLYLVERELLGFDYAAVGAHLLQQWDLSDVFQTTVLFHPEPGRAMRHLMETALLHLSAAVVAADDTDCPPDDRACAADPSAWEITGLSRQDCQQCLQKADALLAEMSDNLFDDDR